MSKELEIHVGEEYYSKRLNCRVTVTMVASGYVTVLDDEDRGYSLPIYDLQSIDDWDAEDILDREG